MSAQNIGMKNKSFANKSKRSGGDALRADVVSANEYTGFVQHIPVTNEDIELYKRMYGGGSFSSDELGN